MVQHGVRRCGSDQGIAVHHGTQLPWNEIRVNFYMKSFLCESRASTCLLVVLMPGVGLLAVKAQVVPSVAVGVRRAPRVELHPQKTTVAGVFAWLISFTKQLFTIMFRVFDLLWWTKCFLGLFFVILCSLRRCEETDGNEDPMLALSAGMSPYFIHERIEWCRARCRERHPANMFLISTTARFTSPLLAPVLRSGHVKRCEDVCFCRDGKCAVLVGANGRPSGKSSDQFHWIVASQN